MAATGEMSWEAAKEAFKVPAWLVWVAALGFVLLGLGGYGILDNNEGLYAEIPREMLASGDWRMWVIPHLNGLPYMEKPPLLYWLTALSFALFGETEWAARMVPALSALSCVGLMLWFGGVINRPQAGRLAALMFISGLGVMAMSHVLMFDMLLTALLTAALMFAWRYRRENRVAFLRWSYAFLALALLAKGFVALILFGSVALAWTLFCRDSHERLLRSCTTWFEPGALLVFVAVGAPWHIVASLTEPIFAWFYFINEHVLRFLGRREPHDYYSGGWWYYLPRMVIYLFPWAFLLFALPRFGVGSGDRKLRRSLLIAWLMPLIFFSVSSAKANYYLVTVMPFAALHLAIALEDRRPGPLARAVPGLLIAVLSALLCVALSARQDDPAQAMTIFGLPQREFAFLLLGGIGALALVAAAGAWRFARAGILGYLIVPVWLAAGMFGILQAMQPTISRQQLAHYIQTELPDRQVYMYRYFEQLSSLPFYLKKTLPIVDAQSNDLFWGNRLRAGNRIYVQGDAFRAAAAGKPLAIVVMDRHLKDFGAAGFDQLFRDRKTIGDVTLFFN